MYTNSQSWFRVYVSASPQFTRTSSVLQTCPFLPLVIDVIMGITLSFCENSGSDFYADRSLFDIRYAVNIVLLIVASSWPPVVDRRSYIGGSSEGITCSSQENSELKIIQLGWINKIKNGSVDCVTLLHLVDNQQQMSGKNSFMVAYSALLANTHTLEYVPD